MYIKKVVTYVFTLMCIFISTVYAHEPADKVLMVEKLNTYFQGYIKIHPDPRFSTLHFEISENGQIPDSPFGVYKVRFLTSENQKIGESSVITDGKFMLPGDIKIVNLESSQEIAQNYLTRISRVTIDPEQAFLIGGNPKADIRLVFFSDYECPYCKQFAERVLPKLLARRDIAVYRYEFPLTSIHPNAEYLARLAIAYRKVMGGKEVPPEFYGKKSSEIQTYMGKLSGDKKDFVLQEAESQETKEAVKKCMDIAEGLKIQDTPTVLINGYKANPVLEEINALIIKIKNKEL